MPDELAADEGWIETTLGSIGKWGSGGTPKRSVSSYYGGSIPWLRIADLNDGLVTEAEETITEEGLRNSSAKLVDPGTLLIAMYGSIGKLGITGIRCATNQAIAFCKPNPALVSTDFLFQLLRYLRPVLVDEGKGGNQSNISQAILKALKVRLPPLLVQERLVRLLTTVSKHRSTSTVHIDAARGAIVRFRHAVLAAACSGQLTAEWRGERKLLPAAQLLDDLRRRHDVSHTTERRPGDVEPSMLDLSAATLPNSWSMAPLKLLCEPGRSITYGILKPGQMSTGACPMFASQTSSRV